MKKFILLCIIAFMSCAAFSQNQLKVTVHPGVELLTIIQILADKYPQPNPSAYSKEVMAYFGKYKNHSAVKKVTSFDKVYTDFVELGWCMSDFPNIKIYEPTDTAFNWYKYYGHANVMEYIKLCKDFFYDTNFWQFYQQHQARYKNWGDDLKTKVDSGKLIDKLTDFYKYKADINWYICIDPLNSWGSHAIMTKMLNPQFSNWLVYNTGYFNKNGLETADPVFDFKNFDNLVWHEGSHIYIQPLLKNYEKQIDSLSYLFNGDDEGMKRNEISNWRYCFDENMVRSITACLYKKYRTQRDFRRQVAREIASDFIYVDDITPFIYDNYIRTNRYSSFADFFPEIIKYLKEKYPKKG